MSDHQDVIGAIGRTPMIKLRRASEETGCTILGKAEFMNPGGSVKDRAALAIVRDAIARGQLKPGGIIVEGTAGNTGIGLALVANAMGFRTVIVIPDTQSQEKKDMLRMQGAGSQRRRQGGEGGGLGGDTLGGKPQTSTCNICCPYVDDSTR